MSITFLQLGNYGRIGNSLFQAATTISHALSNNTDYIFPKCPLLECFVNIPRNKFVDINEICSSFTYEEPHFHYSKIPFKSNMNLHGYFQSEKYFKDYTDLIRETLCPRYDGRIKPGVASIHVRRGDYIQPHLSGCYNILGMDYYTKAMEIIKARKYLVFSDDIMWCKKNFVGDKFTFVENDKDYIDLYIMSKCENNIIANSSFSWWAAWLNKNPSKTVIAPKKWFGPKLSPTHNTSDLIPKGWVLL